MRNLRANPAVSVRIGTRRFAGRARVVDMATEHELWRDVRARSEAKYGWGDGLVVEIVPDATPPSSGASSS